jgi:hypothetical protein
LKLLWENTGKTLEDIGIGYDFLNRFSVAQEIRVRICQWDRIN